MEIIYKNVVCGQISTCTNESPVGVVQHKYTCLGFRVGVRFKLRARVSVSLFLFLLLTCFLYCFYAFVFVLFLFCFWFCFCRVIIFLCL